MECPLIPVNPLIVLPAFHFFIFLSLSLMECTLIPVNPLIVLAAFHFFIFLPLSLIRCTLIPVNPLIVLAAFHFFIFLSLSLMECTLIPVNPLIVLPAFLFGNGLGTKWIFSYRFITPPIADSPFTGLLWNQIPANGEASLYSGPYARRVRGVGKNRPNSLQRSTRALSKP